MGYINILDWYCDCEVNAYPPQQKIVTDIMLIGDRDELTSFEESLAEEAGVSVEDFAVYEISNNNGMKMYILFNSIQAIFGMGIADWNEGRERVKNILNEMKSNRNEK